ncbi:hypothetical protein SmphiM12_481 [Sinorhizobium phage phiM12]|uniref:Uncharacterized protein n=1 Tax=Sinorhizobium phage phiM12 TaxID=1357423 RepID=S5MBV9_9CAUD|nr:hypothetical protein AB690_gp142 [Sinorhizobium phage phiM12]AGR48113.2 hypothetical protein SmphiM12_481 [Sinorhizobium phage phiM12]
MTITFPDEFRLERVYYITGKDDPKALAYIEAHNALLDQMLNGTLYIKFVDGDRKGSIAKIKPRYEKVNKAAIRSSSSFYDRSYSLENDYFFVVASWDRRKNKVQLTLPSRDVIFLPNYKGPTVYELFDSKAAKQAALENPDQYDVDGKLLNIGDKVLYINARYGSAFQLCHGAIREFKAVVNSKTKTITTIVQNDADFSELSAIASPHLMIYKKD